MQGKSSARHYALVVGATLALAGILGFFYVSPISQPERASGSHKG